MSNSYWCSFNEHRDCLYDGMRNYPNDAGCSCYCHERKNMRHPNQADANEALAAFAAAPNATHAWHLHHQTLFEKIDGDTPAGRIAYIMQDKAPDELETRLRLFRPVLNMPAATKPTPAIGTGQKQLQKVWDEIVNLSYHVSGKLSADWSTFLSAFNTFKAKANAVSTTAAPDMEKLHKEQCDPRCPWNGKTIFPSSARVNW